MPTSGKLVVAVDQGVNLKDLRELQRSGRIVLVQAHTLEQSFRHVRDQGRSFRLDASTLDGPDMLVGDNRQDVERIVGKENQIDIEHVYASWLNRNDYFVTENIDDFIRNGRRDALESVLPDLRIRTTVELIKELADLRTTQLAGFRTLGRAPMKRCVLRSSATFPNAGAQAARLLLGRLRVWVGIVGPVSARDGSNCVVMAEVCPCPVHQSMARRAVDAKVRVLVARVVRDDLWT